MNKFNSLNVEESLVYSCNLNFNKDTLQNIIKEIYQIEKEKKYQSNSGRTFKLNKGFHSVNVLDKKYGLLEKYDYIKILVSRIQELVFNYFNAESMNFQKCKGSLNIYEIWINILRHGDYNIPHNHPNCDISGNFYLNGLDPKKKVHNSDGTLLFLKNTDHNYVLDNNIANEGSSIQIIPNENLGVLFRSYKRHVVLPHFTNDDRIGVAFNSKYENNYNYDLIYPIPYCLHIKYSYIIKKEDIKENNILEIKFKNLLTISIPLDKSKSINYFIDKQFNLNYNNMKNIINKQFTINKNKYFKI